MIGRLGVARNKAGRPSCIAAAPPRMMMKSRRFMPSPDQRAGWVERSDPRLFSSTKAMGFAKAQPILRAVELGQLKARGAVASGQFDYTGFASGLPFSTI